MFERIRLGDRDAAARFAIAYGPLIRRRVSGKLGPQLRRLFDSHDILSTVLRRLDVYVAQSAATVSSEAQLWTLILRIAEGAVIDKARISRRLLRVESEDGPLAHAIGSRLETVPSPTAGADSVLDQAFAALEDDTDRRILWHWLSGKEHAVTADLLGMTTTGVRKRWQRIRERVRDAMERDAA